MLPARRFRIVVGVAVVVAVGLQVDDILNANGAASDFVFGSVWVTEVDGKFM